MAPKPKSAQRHSMGVVRHKLVGPALRDSELAGSSETPDSVLFSPRDTNAA